MSVFEFAKSALSNALGPKGPGLPFTVGDFVSDVDYMWKLHDGVKKDDRTPVSVFVFDSTRHRDKLPLARNALRRARTIRHPALLKFIEGAETETKIIIGTEAVHPLRTQSPLKSLNQNLIAWGLYKIAKAIQFLNTDCGMIHGNLRVDSIYVTKAGEWKLGGCEVLSSLKEDNSTILLYGGHVPDSVKYSPPEVRRASWSVCRSIPIHSVDSWAFGCLIHEIFNGFSKPEELGRIGDIPQELVPAYKSFISTEASSRMTMGDFLDKGQWKKGYFDKDFISVSLFLEHMAIKDDFEKENFIRKIDTSLESFPVEFCKYKILPELIQALEFGGAGAKALSPILKLGGKLDQQEFDSLVVPIVIKLFASPDRAIRVSLCEGLPGFINLLGAKIVSDKIFPNLAMGFMDSSAVIREYTLKSVLVIIPKLNEKITNNDLLRYLAKLQQDVEPGIRTNTTICLGKITKYLNESTKKKVLVPAFLRSIRDPFPPARTAGLVALAATADVYGGPECAQQIVPAIAPLLLDPDRQVRKQAFNNMEIFIKKLEKIADTMPEAAAPESAAAERDSSQQAASGEGWAGWALSATAKLATGLAPSGNAQIGGSANTSAPNTAGSSSGTAVSVTMTPLIPVKTQTPPPFDTGSDGWGWDIEPEIPNGASSSRSTVTANNATEWADWGNASKTSSLPKQPTLATLGEKTKLAQATGGNAWGNGWDSDGWDTFDPIPRNPLLGSASAPNSPGQDKEIRRQRLAEQRESRRGKLGARKI